MDVAGLTLCDPLYDHSKWSELQHQLSEEAANMVERVAERAQMWANTRAEAPGSYVSIVHAPIYP